jgi:hypothetical protein
MRLVLRMQSLIQSAPGRLQKFSTRGAKRAWPDAPCAAERGHHVVPGIITSVAENSEP